MSLSKFCYIILIFIPFRDLIFHRGPPSRIRFYDELDYQKECANGIRMEEAMRSVPGVKIPKNYPSTSCCWIWAASKRLEISSFNFKFPRARNYEIIGLVLGCIEAKLQVNTGWKALAEIYTMPSFAPFWNPQSKKWGKNNLAKITPKRRKREASTQQHAT